MAAATSCIHYLAKLSASDLPDSLLHHRIPWLTYRYYATSLSSYTSSPSICLPSSYVPHSSSSLPLSPALYPFSHPFKLSFLLFSSLPPCLGLWKHLLPAVIVLACAITRETLWASVPSEPSWIWDDRVCFTGWHATRCSLQSLWWQELTNQQKQHCSEKQNTKQGFAQIQFHCSFHFDLPSCFWILMVRKQWECEITIAQRAGGVL